MGFPITPTLVINTGNTRTASIYNITDAVLYYGIRFLYFQEPLRTQLPFI